MHLTRARLRLEDSAARIAAARTLDQADRDRGHKLVWTLFHREAHPEDRRAFLYRETGPGAFLVLSRDPPAPAEPIWEVESRPFAPALSEGQRLAFLLRANTTRDDKAGRSGDQRGRRVDVVAQAQLAAPDDPAAARDAARDWLELRLDRIGATLVRDATVLEGHQTARILRERRRGHTDTRFGVADLSGELIVRDPAALVAGIAGGVGRARAYGCGLLLIRPV